MDKKKFLCVFLGFLFACILCGCTEDGADNSPKEGESSMDVKEGTEPVKEAGGIQYEEKVYCNATIDQDFDGSSVLVVMDKNIGGPNKKHEMSFFGGIEIEEIVDLSEFTGDIVGMGINWDIWRQILQIKLPINSKENILYVINVLEGIDGIRSVSPNYQYQLGL